MQYLRRNYKLAILLMLILVNFFIWQAFFSERPSQMKVAFLNVGQGDSTYIETPFHQQVIIDGGPNSAVLSEIGKLLPWYDKYIDVLIISNADIDHYGGFIDIIRRYKIGVIIESGTEGAAPSYKTLESLIESKRIKHLFARRGDSLQLDSGIHIDFLFPDRELPNAKTNNASLISRLVFGSTTVMFTGDAPSNTLEYVAKTEGVKVKSDILKIAHHGSKSSASIPFISAVSPKYATISAGLNNKFGHPNVETMDLLKFFNVIPIITFQKGTIVFKSDGQSWFSDIDLLK